MVHIWSCDGEIGKYLNTVVSVDVKNKYECENGHKRDYESVNYTLRC